VDVLSYHEIRGNIAADFVVVERLKEQEGVCVCVCFYLTSGGAEAHDPGPGGAHRTIGRQKAIRAS
jgi:hypothetical protein